VVLLALHFIFARAVKSQGTRELKQSVVSYNFSLNQTRTFDSWTCGVGVYVTVVDANL